jgi:hypothetical protein
MFFFLKIILILNLEEKKLAGQEKKIYSAKLANRK